jgi:Na+/melibiose symporter-like transporter
MILLVAVCLVVPVRIAFDEEETGGWLYAYVLADLFFFIDLILCFFTSYTDEKVMREVTDHKKIAIRYLKGWFILDLFSIVPFDYFVTSSMASSN